MAFVKTVRVLLPFELDLFLMEKIVNRLAPDGPSFYQFPGRVVEEGRSYHDTVFDLLHDQFNIEIPVVGIKDFLRPLGTALCSETRSQDDYYWVVRHPLQPGVIKSNVDGKEILLDRGYPGMKGQIGSNPVLLLTRFVYQVCSGSMK